MPSSWAPSCLGTQGDPWDTQWDMFLALLGALCAQLTLAGVQDRALRGPTGRASSKLFPKGKLVRCDDCHENQL